MKMPGFKKYLLVPLLLGFCSSGWAVPYPLPDPLPPGIPSGVTVGADIDGTGLFDPVNTLLNIEVFDFVEDLPGNFDAEFGFYYFSDPLTLIPIFGQGDSPFQRATVDFDSGVITDLDTSAELSFIRQTGPIGFYTTAPVFGTRYTQASLNDAGNDLAAAYALSGALPDGTPLIDAYLLGFTRIPGELAPLYASVAGPLIPNPIPLPGAIFLWLTGIAGLALFRRFLGSGSPMPAAATR